MLALLFPVAASAHQHATFHIGDSMYQFVVGSLGEPLVVDDKSGVDLTVTKGTGAMTMSADGDMDGMPKNSAPVAGLDQTLKVEIAAAGQKKTFDLSPQYGKSGAYSATFFPTVATSLSYRFFGTIDGKNIDVTFTCLPQGATAQDEKDKDLGGGVMQVSKAGGFGCPLTKESLGFPEQSTTLLALKDDNRSTHTFAIVAIALSAAALAFSARRRKN